MALSISPTQPPNPQGRDALRARLSALQGNLRAALADKKSRMANIVGLCRSERRAMREELKHKRARALQQIEYEIEALRASARHLRLTRLVEARKSADSDIAAARAAIAVERAHQDELRRIAHEHRRRRAEVHRLHEVAAQSGELHTALLGPFAALVQRVGSKVKPVPGESRAEAVLRYAQVHPGEAHAAAEPKAERAIVETREEIAKTKAALRTAPRTPQRTGIRRPPAPHSPAPPKATARKTPALSPLAIRPLYLDERRAPAPPSRVPAVAKGTGHAPSKAPPARRPGQVPRGGGPGVPLDILLRERDALASKSKKPGRTAPAAREKRAPEAKTRKRKGGGAPPASPPPTAGLPPASVPPLPAANEVSPKRTEKTVKAPEVHDTAALAKLIRQDIQTAVGTCQLPRAKYSVTTEKYSMGSSINVVASKLPFPVLNEQAFTLTNFGPQFDSDRFRSRFTAEAQNLQQKLEDIVGAYHWDRSDSASDYHHERFSTGVRLDDHGEMDRIREKLTKAAKASKSSGAPWKEPPGGLLEPGWYVTDDLGVRRGPFDSKAQAAEKA